MRRPSGRALLYVLRPPLDRRRDEHGRCSVCGAEGRFVFNTWILPRDMVRDFGDRRVVDAFRRRESLWCRSCGASLRVRRIAEVLLEHYAESATTLADLVGEPSFQALEIVEINSIGTAHDVLAAHPRLRYSEYPQEDITALSYADQSADLILTSDTLEHIPDVDAALRETRRILRPGGRHVFTVPAVPSRSATRVRARLEDGRVVQVVESQYHCRGSGPFALWTKPRDDLLAFTDFGLDVLDRLRVAGYQPEVHFLREDDPDADAAIVFCARAV